MWLSNQVVERLREIAVWPEIADGRYTVLQAIGRGGMGTVYVARDEQLGREVALKVSNAPVSGSDLDARLRREARVLATLDHPGIAPVHDAGVLADGRLFYVMKLVRGTTLDQHLRTIAGAGRAGGGSDVADGSGPASPDADAPRERGRAGDAETLRIFERVAETVAFAHAHGIVHRDLKPSNVMVGPFGEVLVLDWGVARVLADADMRSPRGVADAPSVDADVTTARGMHRADADGDDEGRGQTYGAAADATSDGTVIGTPGFMAPEQLDGDTARLGPAADVYALGALLFWLLTGDTPPAPAGRAADTTPAAAAPARLDRALRVRRVPKRLRAIVTRCLAPRAGDRYAQAGAVAQDIARYRGGQAVMAYPETLLDRAGRFFVTYRTFILIIAAYLVMRTIVALVIGRH